VREVGKALGFPADALDRLAKLTGGFEFRGTDGGDGVSAQLSSVGLAPDAPRVQLLLQLLGQIYGLPRHLGQHPGGMVIADGRLDEIVPLEAAAMPGRTIVQWDKEDIADLGIIKFDLLGLGMMAMLEEAQVTLAGQGRSFDLAHVPPGDAATYQLLQKAETIGVFQVESRAQMSCLPRLKPRCFYDLVVEVAIIRPGPIQGNSVHPYLERRAGRQEVRYAHPVLEPILRRTLGVPLFQEQAMRIAMAAADFTAAEADELRRAMGHKRSRERMQKIKDRLMSGMRRNGIGAASCEEIWTQLQAFADYGFPESHAASFALLVYASAYLKVHEPEVFYASLLNCQPMGFYSPATIVREALQRGVRILPIDVMHSRWPTLIVTDSTGKPALRLGLVQVVGLGEVARGHLEVLTRGLEQTPLQPATLTAFVRRARQAGLGARDLERLAEAGALRSLVRSRRDALWQLRALEKEAPLAPAPLEEGPAPLQPMSVGERIGADYRTCGLTLGPHPMSFHRAELDAERFLRAVDLPRGRDGSTVRVAGQVIVRQRPGSAKGFFFLTLEDETGLINLIVKPDRFQQDRTLLARSGFLAIEGQLQHKDGVISVRVERARELPPPPLGPSRTPPSRDFR
jgi:error-prone DNA polymerase